MLNIELIKLLSGSHSDTAVTGSGCFMNVIAYLNGEPQITDKSPCVCVTIRPIAIWLNDYLRDGERHLLLPYVQRAMSTATEDKAIMAKRLTLVVGLANDMASLAGQFSSEAAAGAARAAAARAAAAAWSAAAGGAAEHQQNREKIIAVALAFMEAICPPADELGAVIIERATKLVELATVKEGALK